MEYFAEIDEAGAIGAEQASECLDAMLERLGRLNHVMLVPPDYTRAHSGAGELTAMLHDKLRRRGTVVEVLPALGTHVAMTADEIGAMYRGIPRELFRVHDWRRGIERLGEVPGDFVRQISAGAVDYAIACELNRLLLRREVDRIISVGQLVPHEVAGIANQSKNILVGTGGSDAINKTHFLGAVCGMEAAMGRADTPVRRVLRYMEEHFLADLPISYVLTVRAKDANGALVTRGLFGGDDSACFERGADLCRRVNLDLLDAPLRRVVVYLDPREYKSTWLGNKAIYRTRMAMADEGDLVVIGPGVHVFGEDPEIDRLIRKYGYRGTPHTLRMVRENEDLAGNLSAAAHLIHGSSEGRFSVTYCPGGLTRDEVESVGFIHAEPDRMLARYNPSQMRDGMNQMADGEEVFFVSNPGLGLWGLKQQFA